jgi:hypothetical protein
MLISLRAWRQAKLSYRFQARQSRLVPGAVAANTGYFHGGRNHSGFGRSYAKLSALLIQH